MKKQLIVFSVSIYACGLWILCGLVSCGGDNAPSTRLGSEVTEMVRNYHQMKELGLAGEVEAFLDMRDSVTMSHILHYYGFFNKKIDSAWVSGWAYNWPDVAGLPLIQDTSDGEWRRLTFIKEGLFDKDGREKYLCPIILFRKNGDVWKVSNASRMSSYKYNQDGTERTFDQLTFHKLFGIPPNFEDLHLENRPAERPPLKQIDPKEFQRKPGGK